MDELDGLEEFIYSLLRGHLELNEIILGQIYPDVAPEGVKPPFVIYTLQFEEDKNAVGYEGRRIFVRPDYIIKGISQSDSLLEAAFIGGAIDNAIVGQNNDDVVLPDVRVRGAFRSNIVRYSEHVDGIRYNHRGGVYRFFAHLPRR